MLLKEFPALSALTDGAYNEIWETIPFGLYKTLEMLHQERIPNGDYSMSDLERLIKSVIFRQTKPGRHIVMGGSPYLELNRNGEGGSETFAGFGENYNAMEIRISRGIRKSYLDRVIDSIGELIESYRYSYDYKG